MQPKIQINVENLQESQQTRSAVFQLRTKLATFIFFALTWQWQKKFQLSDFSYDTKNLLERCTPSMICGFAVTSRGMLSQMIPLFRMTVGPFIFRC